MVLQKQILFLFFLQILIACKSNVNEDFNNDNLKKNIDIKKTNVNITLVKKKLLKKIKSNGKVEVIFKKNMYFKTGNILLNINFKNGSFINKGDTLAKLYNSLAKIQLKKAELNLRHAEYKFEEDSINYSSSTQSKHNFLKLKLKSGLLDAYNFLNEKSTEYNQTILIAPISGIIVNLDKNEGDFITTSDIFCSIINPNFLEVSFSVLENEFGFISKGQKIEIQSLINKNQQLNGVITEINPIVDKNGLIKIKAKVTSKNTALLDGMNVNVFINKPLKDVLVIPKEALVLRSNREVVFTVEKGFAKWNYVEVVTENNDSYAIKKGLKATDTIIVSGNLNLSHDAKVNTTFINDDTTQ